MLPAEAVKLILAKHAENMERFGNPTYNSFHEAKGVIDEEYDEWWDEVKKRRPNKITYNVDGSVRSNGSERIVEEAIDLAAAVFAVIVEAEELP